MNIQLGAGRGGCANLDGCADFAAPLHKQLTAGRYDYPASILRLVDHDGYLAAHRTARKRAARAARLGYLVDRIDRSSHIDEIHRINTSAPRRQGKPMTAGYLQRPNLTRLPDYPCPRHRIDEWGVLPPAGRLVGYLVLYVCGDLALVSQILGHADHLDDDIMYLLVTRALTETLEVAGPLVVFYNRHDSGTDGLRYFKERLGFEPARVAWAL